MEKRNSVKINHLEISHTSPLDFIKVYVNNNLIAECYNQSELVANFEYNSTLAIKVEFSPFKIKPVVRYKNFMLNYWLADILLYDHKLEFTITDKFYEQYKNKDIEGRLAHLSVEEKNLDNMYDKYIGINNLYPDLVAEIKNLIS